MNIKVYINVNDVRWYRYTTHLRRLINQLLPHRKCIIFLTLTNEKEMKEINNRYRFKNKSTNVLSFPMENSSEDDCNLGDIFFSYEDVKRGEKPFKNHLTHLLIHGILHLLGYDHKTPREASMMENLEIKILASFNIGNPYELVR